MKKVFLLTITAGLAVSSFAQNAAVKRNFKMSNAVTANGANERTTAHNDTLAMKHAVSTDSILLYYTAPTFDSGFTSGMNGYSYDGFAERYDFNSADSTIKVVGVETLFGGVLTPTSTKTVTFKLWSVGAAQPASIPHYFYSGFPVAAAMDSLANVPITSLGIGTTADTFKIFVFPTMSATLTSSFFVGYTPNYTFASLAGDTIALNLNANSQRVGAVATFAAGDTTINDVSVTHTPTGWVDNLLVGTEGNYFIYPVVIANVTVGFKGITNHNFTFFGNYPNPATNVTNVKFGLSVSSDVTITVTDMAGRTVNVIKEHNLSSGEHTVAVETANMPSGEYVYVIQASAGGGIASKFTVAK